MAKLRARALHPRWPAGNGFLLLMWRGQIGQLAVPMLTLSRAPFYAFAESMPVRRRRTPLPLWSGKCDRASIRCGQDSMVPMREDSPPI